MYKHIPNILTIIRFLLVPVFLYYVIINEAANHISIAFIVFVLASFTDYLDGMLARKYKVISDFGKIMDPLADKLLVLSALGCISWLHPYYLPKLIFFIILARELLVTILREIYQKKGIVLAADKLGKLKTVMQMAGIIFAYFCWAYLGTVSKAIITLVIAWFWLVVLITLISGINYIKVLFYRRNP
mgnify:CR=1 FL=1